MKVFNDYFMFEVFDSNPLKPVVIIHFLYLFISFFRMLFGFIVVCKTLVNSFLLI